MKVIEYLAGPACGRREYAVPGVDGRPGPFRLVLVPARYGSALDDHPTVPEEIHRYDLAGETAGDVWQYTWSAGPLH